MLHRTIYWQDDTIRLIDQTRLPTELREIRIEDIESLREAIRSLAVRGAPAIGVAAALGVLLGTLEWRKSTSDRFLGRVNEVAQYLGTSRPTAVNLFWALGRMKRVAEDNRGRNPEEIWGALKQEADAIIAEDDRVCRRIGANGASLLKDGDIVLTHCNAGSLATSGYGTALGVIYAAKEEGKRLKVFADETRPLLQGARLTAWELMEAGVDVTLICDSMAAVVMRDEGVKAVIVGADRIAANGDVANKIGTYGVAVLARSHGVPFYVAAPISTIDRSIASGTEIPIEQRDASEVVNGYGRQTAPDRVPVFNPAFDVTPAALVTAIITENGVARAPFEDSIAMISAG